MSLESVQAASMLSESNVIAMLKNISLCIITILPTIYVSYGISEASKGIANAADIRIDTAMTIMPMCFVTASLIYTLILFATINSKNVKTIEMGIRCVASSLMLGAGSAFAAYAVGSVTKNAVVARAQNKKFSAYFMVMLMFSEAVAIFSLIFALVIVFKD